jgi:hypothetical protein
MVARPGPGRPSCTVSLPVAGLGRCRPSRCQLRSAGPRFERHLTPADGPDGGGVKERDHLRVSACRRETPRSLAIRPIGSPEVLTRRIASALNSDTGVVFVAP